MTGSNGPFRYPGGQPVSTPFGGEQQPGQNTGQNFGADPFANSQPDPRYHDNAPAADRYAQPQAPASHSPTAHSYAEHSPRQPRQLNSGRAVQQSPEAPTFGGSQPQWTEPAPSGPAAVTPQAPQQYSQDFSFSDPTMTASQQGRQPGFGQPLDAHHQPPAFQPAADPFAPAQPQQPAPSGYDFGAHHGASAGADFSAAALSGDPGLNWGDGTSSRYANEPSFSGHQDFAFQDPAMDPGQQPVAMEHGLEDDEDYDYDYEDDEGHGRGRKVLIAAALAGAIVVGGGVAYGYQALFSPVSSDALPVVKSAKGPAKIKPSDPGGRKFAHTDSKIMGRLGSAGSESTTDPATGARRVSTLKIGRDGSIVPPTAPMGAGGPRMVSGMTLGDTSGPVANAASTAAAPPIEMAKVSPIQKVKAAPAAAAVAIKNEASAAKAEPAPVPKKVTKPVAKPTKTAALLPPKKPVATGPKPTGAGYVAVLASVPASNSSRMDALKQFADMQQKYGSVLNSRTPDVQEANLGAKGTYHRLIAGPPGSAQSARSVCNELKSAGYQDCWVLAF